MSLPRVLVTRAEEDADGLCEAIASAGGEAVRLPLLGFEAGPDKISATDGADAPDGDVVVAVTSPRAVDAVAEADGSFAVAVVGQGTARRARERGLNVALVSDGSGAGALADALVARRPARVVWACGERSLPILDERLGAAGIPVIRRTVYRTVVRRPEASVVEAALTDLAAATFTSPSTVEALVGCAPQAAFEWVRGSVPCAALGRTTAEALELSGFRLIRVARESSDSALARAALGR